MKFQRGQAVYHAYDKSCYVIDELFEDNHASVKDARTEFVCPTEALRALHETGYYVPEDGDVRREGYQYLNHGMWLNGHPKIVGVAIRYGHTKDLHRFPLPLEAHESEKWAREQESSYGYTKSN